MIRFSNVHGEVFVDDRRKDDRVMARDGLALDPGGPLRRADLVTIAGDVSWLRRVLRTPDRIVAHLAGSDQIDPAIVRLGVNSIPFACPAATQIARALDGGQPLIWIRSVLGTAGASVAVAALAEAGADSLTYFQLTGPAGVIADDGMRYPCYGVFEALASLRGAPLRACTVSRPDEVAALADGKLLLLANMMPTPKTVQLATALSEQIEFGPYEVKLLKRDNSGAWTA